MINLCNTLLLIDRTHALPAVIGNIFKPLPVIDKIIEADVAPILTIQSTDSIDVLRDLYFLYFFFDLCCLFLNYVIISLQLLIWLLKLFTSFVFISNPCSKSCFSSGADGYNLFVLCSICIA